MSAFFCKKINVFKITIKQKTRFTDYAFGIWLLDCSKVVMNLKNGNDFTVFWRGVNVNFVDVDSLVKFSYWSKFRVNIITGSGVMTISFYKGWPEIQRSEIAPSEIWPISGDWRKLQIPNLARTSLIKCYWMLQNARVTAFIVAELLRENQQRGKFTPSQIRVKS